LGLLAKDLPGRGSFLLAVLVITGRQHSNRWRRVRKWNRRRSPGRRRWIRAKTFFCGWQNQLYSTEALLPTPHEKVQRTHGNLTPWPNLSQHIQEVQQLMLSGSDQSIRAKIQDIVPEYSYEAMVGPSDSGEQPLATPRVIVTALAQTAAAND
jgi:hypothetical protein